MQFFEVSLFKRQLSKLQLIAGIGLQFCGRKDSVGGSNCSVKNRRTDEDTGLTRNFKIDHRTTQWIESNVSQCQWIKTPPNLSSSKVVDNEVCTDKHIFGSVRHRHGNCSPRSVLYFFFAGGGLRWYQPNFPLPQNQTRWVLPQAGKVLSHEMRTSPMR